MYWYCMPLTSIDIHTRWTNGLGAADGQEISYGLWAQCDSRKANAKEGRFYGRDGIPETASVKLEFMLFGVLFACG